MKTQLNVDNVCVRSKEALDELLRGLATRGYLTQSDLECSSKSGSRSTTEMTVPIRYSLFNRRRIR
jgi:hypothetical protein